MPISLTCTCGARLDIDDKFAGQSIPCPDCNKPLLAEPPAPPPTRTSGLAILSLVLALVGAFTVVGTLAAVACGAVAYRQITRKRSTVGGVRIAQAGMVLGGLFTVLAVAAYGSRLVFGIDGLYRQYLWAGRLDYSQARVSKRTETDRTYSLERPSDIWGKLSSSPGQNDLVMFANLRDDAYILWLSSPVALDDANDPGSLRSRALEAFRGSDMVKLIGKLPDNVSEPFKERGLNEVGRVQEFFLDAVLGGIPRTFLFRVTPDGTHINVLVGGARAHRFAKLEATLRQAFDTFKQEAP